MEVSVTRHLISLSDYHRMIEADILTENDKVELIHGEIIEMSPIGYKHIAAVNRISNILKEVLGKKAIVSVQNPIPVSDHSEPEPDITLLKPDPEFYASGHPELKDVLLVIEVADSTWHYDREVKRPLYAEAGIPELWLVNVNKHEIEVHRTPTTDTYKHISIMRPGDSVTLSNFDANVSVEDLLGHYQHSK